MKTVLLKKLRKEAQEMFNAVYFPGAREYRVVSGEYIRMGHYKKPQDAIEECRSLRQKHMELRLIELKNKRAKVIY